MANKNLIKRAFSVTANLPTQRSEAPAPADASVIAHDPHSETPAPDAPAVDAPSHRSPITALSTAMSVPKPTAAPRTSPGSMLAFMAEQSEVHKEVVELRQRLGAFDGANVVKRLDPTQVSASKWANRDRSHFASEAFARLKAEIESAGGNIQPIKVRSVSGATPDGPHFEIVYGHRRHQACLELGIPVLALVEDEMKDAQLFIEMDRENREREDLSPWEQGVMYTRALDEGLFPSAKQLAAALGVDMGTVSKARTLSALPQEVVAAFTSPLDLQFRWGKLLTEALQKDPEGVLERARSVAAHMPRPSSTEALKMLIQAKAPKCPVSGSAAWLDGKGKQVATMNTDRKGRVTVLVESLDETQQRRLIKLMDGFLGVRSE
jgi:ParB family chromosome partitioning protein